MKHKICVLTGAGISAESGIRTFRDAGGLWEGYNVHDVATPEAWERNQPLVLDFYNQRRKQLKTVRPNNGHLDLISLESSLSTTIITQNVDDLHERAGSKNIIHLHGELNKVRSTLDERIIYPWLVDLKQGDTCELGSQLRPHIVWFGEGVPKLEESIHRVSQADFILIVGTSMQVYPAASLTAYASPNARIYYVDPNPQINHELSLQRERLTIYKGLAGTKVKEAVNDILTASADILK